MGISGMRAGLLLAGPLFLASAIGIGRVCAAPTPLCARAVAAFDGALKTGAKKEVVNSFYAVTEEPGCASRVMDGARARLVDFLVDYARAHPPEAADTIRLAERTVDVSGNWRGKGKIADYYFDHRSDRDMPDALANSHLWYQKSVDDFSTADPRPTDAERQVMLKKLGAANALANNDQEGRRKISPSPARRDATGQLGGIYSSEFRSRGTFVGKVPIPVQFVYDQATPTPVGDKSIQELAEVAMKLEEMTLVGHADPRGSPDYNMELSRKRVIAVRDALVRLGVTAKISIAWKGATEEYDWKALSNGSPLTQEEIWQLDRRVEWIW
jgi:outer membrane protein OmpA-like peptidoglycan-associated protein